MLRLMALIALSLFIHIMMYESVWYLPPAPRPSSGETEIEVVEEKPQDSREKKFDKPVVKNTKITASPAEMKDPTDFMAEHNQRFKEQTKATRLGVMQNRAVAENKKYQQEQKAQQGTKNKAEDGELPEFAQEVQNQIERIGVSTVPYKLPDEIKDGTATNLNADAHIYASFYNRVVNLFYVRWAQRLDEVFMRIPTEIKKDIVGKSWTTELEIWLNAEGLYEEALVMRSSGFKPFDDAGVYAFKTAKYFPNPPRAKVQADGGRVRLKYRITFHAW